MKYVQKHLLLSLLSIFLLLSNLYAADIIIDNGGPGTSFTGTWSVSAAVGPWDPADGNATSLWSRSGGTYTWHANLPESGIYNVYMWHTYYPSRSTNAPVTITYNGGSVTVPVNQKQNAGTWYYLTTQNFNAAAGGTVKITAKDPYPTTYCADAVKFVFDSNGEPPACLLNAKFNTATLTQGMYYYTDRTYTLTSVPAQYSGLPMIKTPNSELGLTNSSGYMTFELTSPATVYVAYDSRGAGSLPAWMNGFTYTGNDIQTSLSTQPSLRVYSREFAAGCTDLGANKASPATGYYSNYIVFYDDGPVTYDFYCDDDGDGYIDMQSDGSCTGIGCQPAGCQVAPGNDCNDLPDEGGNINPGAAEVCDDGVDNDCDGSTDSEDSDCGSNDFHCDDDGDGYIDMQSDGSCTGIGCQPAGCQVAPGNDCNDLPDEGGNINPGAAEVCDDGIDNDCDGSTDSNDSDCGSNPSQEHIYLMSLFGPFTETNDSDFIATMQDIGAQKVDNYTWTYTNSAQRKSYVIHNAQDFDTMKQCLYGEHHCIFRGHSNYGIGGNFISNYTYSRLHTMLDNIRYIDDDNIFNYSAPTVSVPIASMAHPGKWTNWWPIDSYGKSGIMPYNFGDPRGDPPFNYYIMYKVPGDPRYYKVETVRNSARQRFPDSRAEPWDFNNGPAPDSSNPDHRKYFIINPTLDYDWGTTKCGPTHNLECPQPHFGKKTIIFPIKLDIDINKLKYKRLFLDMCTTCSYNLDTFHRGQVFCTTGTSGTRSSFRYLKEYVKGKSNQEIWEILQRGDTPIYEYYDFTKPTFAQ